MRDFAIISASGRQYLVRPSSVIRVGKLAKEGKTHAFTDLLAGKKVQATVLSQGRTAKVAVRKFKSKVRYLRRKSYRAPETTLHIDKISA